MPGNGGIFGLALGLHSLAGGQATTGAGGKSVHSTVSELARRAWPAAG